MAVFGQAFCDTPFWDLKITWYTEWPSFTSCFQHTVLVWVPCLYLWVFSPLYLYATRKRKGPTLPCSWLMIMKLIFSLSLVGVTVSELAVAWQRHLEGFRIPRVMFCSASTKILTFVLATIFQIRDKNIGKRSSGFLFIFWLMQSVFSLFEYRSVLRQILVQDEPVKNGIGYIITVIYYPLLIGQLFISAFSEKKPSSKPDEKPCPLIDEPFLSLFNFAWVDGIVFRGYRKILELNDLFRLSSDYKSEVACSRFYRAWEEQLKKRNLLELENKQLKSKDSTTSPSIVWAIMKAFWPFLMLGSIMEICFSVSRFIPILFLNLLIDFSAGNQEMWKGYLYAGIIFLATVADSYVLSHLLFYIVSAALQLKSALVGIIYRKALRLSSSAKQDYTSGELVNLMAVDTERIYNFSMFANMIWGAPIRITITLVLLWQYLGPSCLVGLAVILLTMPITLLIARCQHVVQEEQMGLKDSRMKIMNEILNGIKVLKLYAWEHPFMKLILDIRNTEVVCLKKSFFLNAAFGFVWACSPFLVALFSFLTYVLIDERNILTPSTAFVSLTLFNTLRFSLIALPDLVSNLVQTRVSLARLSKFFLAEELDLNNTGTKPPQGEAVAVEGGTFTWVKDETPTLRDLDLHVKMGQLVAVVGQVGSGKSSLLSAMLGEMDILRGTVDLRGSKAYVPQQAWIQNATLQQNILFTHGMNNNKYQKVLDACCLLPDLEILPAGDQTEIGEKGVNLSGGQKHRVSLARAVYQNADIYLLDDPLSAVDSHVGKHLFQHVIGPNGMLNYKTRVLVTHNISVLPETDMVVVMKNGEIQEIGTYKDLMAKKGHFADFIEEHLRKGDEAELESESETAGDSESRRRLYSLSSVGSDTEATNVRWHTVSSRQTSVIERANSVSSDRVPNASALSGALIEEEKMESGKVKSAVYIKYLQSAGFPLVAVMVFGIMFFQASDVSASFWLSAWSNDKPLADGTQNIPLRNLRLGIYGTFGALEVSGMVVASVTFAFAAMRASRRLHYDMLACIIKCPMHFFDTTPMGRILNRFGKDIDIVDTQLPSNFDAWCDCFMAVLGTFIVISINNATFLIAAIPIGILFFITLKLFISTTRQLERLSSVTRSPVYSNFQETISGVSSVRAYGVQGFFIGRSNDRVDINTNCVFHSICVFRWLSARLGILSGCIALATSLLAVLGRGTLDAGLVGLSLSYALSVTDAFTWMVRMSGELESKIVCVERIDEYSTVESEAPWEIESTKPPKSWPRVGAVTFEDYSTRYRGGLDLVLQDISLSIHPMEKIGIVGRTGAGKSSLTLSLFRIIEAAKGAIYIDDVNIATIGLHDLRQKISVIPQDPVLFTGSMRFNLDPNHDYSDTNVWEALAQAHLKEFVKSLMGGLDFKIAEGGENLSVGQRQLVCLARALLRKSRVLVLDEATAAVDLETDKMIQQTIRTEFSQSTIITIAHRLHTILDYDRVMVMDQGRIVETGAPGDLMDKTDSYFYALAKDAGLV